MFFATGELEGKVVNLKVKGESFLIPSAYKKAAWVPRPVGWVNVPKS